MEDVKSTLSSFDSLILVKVKSDLDHIYESSFSYELGSFEMNDMINFHNFNEVISSIYRSASICEGIGYYEYVNQIKESIYFCLKEGKRSSYVLPLRKENDNHTYYYMMSINKRDDAIYALFIYFDEKSGLYNFDDISTGNYKDALTGLFNYRTLVSHINENKRRGYLILFDLNGFKLINDTHGHEVGDIVLKDIANYLISIATMKEVFYRRSGDEFMILIFENDMDYVLSLINKIEAHLEDMPNIIKKDIQCSAAFGVLELSKDDHKLLGYEIQSKLTDLAMYQAKTSHKRYHYISHDDALSIIEKGELEKRIKDITKRIR